MKFFRLSVLAMLLLALSACAGNAPIRQTPVAPTAPPTEELIEHGNSGDPGLVVKGTVTLDGQPLEGVKIYRSLASYEGEVVAVTGTDGTYRSEFMYIPGDEMVTVWAELEGYSFTPEQDYWRHYYGHEERTVDFTGEKVNP